MTKKRTRTRRSMAKKPSLYEQLQGHVADAPTTGIDPLVFQLIDQRDDAIRQLNNSVNFAQILQKHDAALEQLGKGIDQLRAAEERITRIETRLKQLFMGDRGE